MANFKIRYTTDIHLVLDNGNMSLDLFITPAGVLGGANISPTPLGIVNQAVNANDANYLTLTPVVQGETYIRISSNQDQNMIRVRVHEEFNRIWFGNEKITLFQDEENYRPTLFAEFNDTHGGNSVTSFGDISEHLVRKVGAVTTKPVVFYQSMDENFVEIKDNNKVFGVAQTPGSVDIEAHVLFDQDAYGTIPVGAGGVVAGANFNLIDGGSNYAAAPRVRIMGGSGTGAAATANIVGNAVTGIALTEAGANYQEGDVLKVMFIRNDPDEARGTAVISAGGVVTGINFVQGGQNYDEVPIVRIEGGGGSGATATANILNGSVTGFTMGPGGAGYNSAPEVFITRAGQRCPVSVKESLKTIAHEVLDRFRTGTAAGPKRNLLFLGEGFATSGDFITATNDISRFMFDSPTHEPYQLLKEEFDVWRAWVPNDPGNEHDGVSIRGPVFDEPVNDNTGAFLYQRGIPAPFGPPQTPNNTPAGFYNYEQFLELVGLPYYDAPATLAAANAFITGKGANPALVNQDVFNYWKRQEATRYLQVKDTLLGYSLSTRPGDRTTQRWANPIPARRWAIPTDLSRVVVPDSRRSGYNTGYIQRLLKSLKFGNIPANADYHMGNTWTEVGPDKGLVVIITNETYYAGTRRGDFFASSIGNAGEFVIEQIAGSAYRWTNTIRNGFIQLERAAAVYAHEFGHSTLFQLKDEYENIDSDTDGEANDAEEIEDVESGPNTTTFAKIEHPQNPVNGLEIDPGKIKWNWHRIRIASNLTALAANGAAPNTIEVTIDPAEIPDWQAIQAEGLNVFLSTRSVNPYDNEHPYFFLGLKKALVITNLNAGTGVATLTGDTINDEVFDTDSYVYAPQLSFSKVVDLDITTPGQGYSKAPGLEISGGGGRGAKAKVLTLDGNGGIDTIEVTKEGGSYLSLPSVRVKKKKKDNPNPVAVLKPVLEPQNTEILTIQLVDGGSGYNAVPNINIVGGDLAGNNPGTVATANAVLGSLALTGINLVNAGANYVNEPVVTVNAPSGSGAVVDVYVSGGSINISNLPIRNPGIGYPPGANQNIINVAGGGGANAALTADVCQNGWLTAVNVTNGGNGYIDEAKSVYLKIVHPVGSGARAKATVNGGGNIVDIIMISQGANYTNAGLVVTLDSPSNANEVAPTLTAVLGGGGAITDITHVNPAAPHYYTYDDLPLTINVLDQAGNDMGAVIKGSITPAGQVSNVFDIIDPGSGYILGQNYYVVIKGGVAPGEVNEASATAVLSRSVSRIEITNRGAGYRRIPEVQIVGGGGAGAVAYADIAAYGHLIDQPVYDEMYANRAPLTTKNNNNTTSTEILPPGGLPAIAGYRYPRAPYLTPGLYEGGSTFNLKAFRPTFNSKMRTGVEETRTLNTTTGVTTVRLTYHPFNYPSRYYMVSMVNPALLRNLDDQMQNEFGR